MPISYRPLFFHVKTSNTKIQKSMCILCLLLIEILNPSLTVGMHYVKRVVPLCSCPWNLLSSKGPRIMFLFDSIEFQNSLFFCLILFLSILNVLWLQCYFVVKYIHWVQYFNLSIWYLATIKKMYETEINSFNSRYYIYLYLGNYWTFLFFIFFFLLI